MKRKHSTTRIIGMKKKTATDLVNDTWQQLLTLYVSIIIVFFFLTRRLKSMTAYYYRVARIYTLRIRTLAYAIFTFFFRLCNAMLGRSRLTDRRERLFLRDANHNSCVRFVLIDFPKSIGRKTLKVNTRYWT